jgi:exodeoxyribonuclease VII small subunit
MAKVEKVDNIESKLAELEAIVEKMEAGDLPLEEALADFEKGVVLIKASQKILEKAEQTVKMLTQQNGIDVLEAFDDED